MGSFYPFDVAKAVLVLALFVVVLVHREQITLAALEELTLHLKLLSINVLQRDYLGLLISRLGLSLIALHRLVVTVTLACA